MWNAAPAVTIGCHMTAPILRPYQKAFIGEFQRDIDNGIRRILGVAPTAAGKTVIFADVIRSFVAAYKPVLVLAHRREIIGQTSKEYNSRAPPPCSHIVRAGLPLRTCMRPS